MSQRLTRVNELLKREISTVVQKDFEFPNALVTVNEVKVTQDLKEAKVFVGVLGAKNADEIIRKLNVRHGFIQGRVAKRVVLRNTPVLDFRLDSSSERGVDMVNFLQHIEETIEPARDSDEGSESE